jgi:hypothetical protein
VANESGGEHPADLLESGPADRRVGPVSARRARTLGAVAALLLAVVAVATWLPGEPVPAPTPTSSASPTRSPPPRPLPADAPRDVVLLGSAGAARLLTLDQPPKPVPLAANWAQELGRLVELRQLSDGRLVGLDRAAGEVFATRGDDLADLGAAGSYFIGRRDAEVWTVRPPPLPGGAPVIRRFGSDGAPLAPVAVLPAGALPVGEVSDGLLVSRAGSAPPERDLVVIDPATGAEVRTLATGAAVADVRAGLVAWYHDPCHRGDDCLLHLEDTRSRVSVVVPSAQGVDQTVRGDLARLSSDGAWLAYPQSLSAELGDPRSSVFELAVADTRGDAPRTVPDSQGVFAGMVPLWSGERLLFLRGRPAAIGVYRPGPATVIYGVADVSKYEQVAGALDLATTG